MDIRGAAKDIYYPGPASQTPAVTVSLDGAAPSSVSGTQTTEYAAGQYKTALAAEQMDAGTVVVTIVFAGYQPVQVVIETESDEYATAGGLAAVASTVETIDSKLGSAEVTVVAPVAQDGTLRLSRGADYLAADGRALSWQDTDGGWPSLTGAAVKLKLFRGTSDFTCTVVDSTTVQLELTAAQTADLPYQYGDYELWATLALGSEIMLAYGNVVPESA